VLLRNTLARVSLHPVSFSAHLERQMQMQKAWKTPQTVRLGDPSIPPHHPFIQAGACLWKKTRSLAYRKACSSNNHVNLKLAAGFLCAVSSFPSPVPVSFDDVIKFITNPTFSHFATGSTMAKLF
jgi:hypothetical protein